MLRSLLVTGGVCVQLNLNSVMRTIKGWILGHGNLLALNKPEIVGLTKKRIYHPCYACWKRSVVTKPATKDLCILIDIKLHFWEQIRRTAETAAK